MTGIDVPRTVTADAVSAAERAANTAGVTVRELTELADLTTVHRLYDEIWRPEPEHHPMTKEMLRALAKADNYVVGAFDGDRLVGACVGFFGPPTEHALHSHIAGVSATATGRGVGFALKVHQRAWALRRGIAAITWTFDPLIARNAHFNLRKLAATATEYLPDFYGGLHDAINGEDLTDRLLVRWPLEAPQVVAACAGTPARALSAVDGAVTALARSEDGRPIRGALHGHTVLVATPTDVAALRATDPGLARQWRSATRDVLGALLADGARITGFARGGWYVLTRQDTR